MKYGNISGPTEVLTKIKEEITAVEDLLEKGKLTEEEAFTKKRNLQLAAGMYIARTNGGYTPPRPSGRDRKRLLDWRREIEAKRAEDIIKKVIEEDEPKPEETQP